MTTYRCAGCREYKRDAPFRRVGLGSVCSVECWRTAATRKGAKTPTVLPDVPDDVRRAVKERDRNRCRVCGTTKKLHVHHIAYRSQGGTHDEHNLIVLCETHHSLVHADKARWQPVLWDYIRGYYARGVRASLLKLDRERRSADAGQ